MSKYRIIMQVKYLQWTLLFITKLNIVNKVGRLYVLHWYTH